MRQIYPVSSNFTAAMNEMTVHHIRGTVTTISGDVISITDELCGDIRTESQCVTDSMQFNIGGMYVGTLTCSLKLSSSMRDEIYGGTITLDFGAEVPSGIEWIPLGIWNINSCSTTSAGFINITAMDNLCKLLVDTEESYQNSMGVVDLKRIMKHVTKLTGLEFEQTAAEIIALTDNRLGENIFGVKRAQTAWHEVKSIAEIIGGFAFANRQGKIEFRLLNNDNPVLTIASGRRHDIQLEEYTYNVLGVRYVDAEGFAAVCRWTDATGSGSILEFSDNLLVLPAEGVSRRTTLIPLPLQGKCV